MILYLMKDYNLGFAKGNNILFFWSAATNFLPLLGAFLSDSYLGRFLTIAFGSIASFLVFLSFFFLLIFVFCHFLDFIIINVSVPPLSSVENHEREKMKYD